MILDEPTSALDRTVQAQRIEELLERVDLARFADVQLGAYSKGMLQRAGLAQALINDPELVVLDEPMSGLDPLGRALVRDVILEERERGRTVFFSSHILQDVELICDRVAIVTHGQLRAEGPLDELLDAPTEAVEVIARGLTEAAQAQLATQAASTHGVGAGRSGFMLASEAEIPAFLSALQTAGGALVSVTPHRRSLEEIFVETARRGAGA